MHIFLIAAMSIDGYIARDPSVSSTEWTSGEDKKLFRVHTLRAGVLVMGSTTFATIGRALPGRKCFVLSSKPKPAAYAQIPDSEVQYTSESVQDLVERLAAEGCTELAVCGGSEVYSQFLLAHLVDTLYLTVEPFLLGAGTLLWKSSYEAGIQTATLVRTEKLNESGTLFLEYSLKKAGE